MDNMENNYGNSENTTQQSENSSNNYSYGEPSYQSDSYNYGGNQEPNYYEQQDNDVLSMGDWLIMLLALLIPCAGIILYFVWAFRKNENANRRNFCRAYLIYWAITTVLSIIALIVIVGVVVSGFGSYYYY